MVIIKIDDNGILFLGHKWQEMRLRDYHPQDCCEHHYADWETLDLHKEYICADGTAKKLGFFDFPEDINELIIPVKDLGFFLKANDGTKILVNCYAENNGWYNTNLELRLEEISYVRKGTLDISECQRWEHLNSGGD